MDTQKAIELLEKSEHAAILLPPEPDIDCWASAEVLARALEEKGKTIGFLPTVRAGHADPPPAFKKVLNSSPLAREFIVSLDTASSPASQLRYEKHNDRIDVIFSPKTVAIRKDAFSFRDGNVQCDCIIALGIPDVEVVTRHPDMDPRILTEVPIINMDTSAENRKYGEVNLVSEEKTSLSEIICQLLQSSDNWAPAGETATLLLAGIMAATDSFTLPIASGAAMTASSGLISAGASYAAARDLARADHTLPLLQLASRAAVRSKENGTTGVLWSFLTAEDFEKTGRQGADITFVLRHLSALLPPQKIHVLLWQDPQEKNIRAILGADAPVLEAIANQESGSFQSPRLALHARFSNFQEAEEHIDSLLKRAL